MDERAIVSAIRGHRAAAVGALAAIQSTTTPLTVEVIELLARRQKKDPAEYWLNWLKATGNTIEFVNALRARSVPVGDDVFDDSKKLIPPDKLAPFFLKAEAFRCRIEKNGKVAGSGVLVGPRLVLTSWHVIATGPPGSKRRSPPPQLKVVLADGRQRDARVPALFESECGAGEYNSQAPVRDDDVLDRNDVALLELQQPAAVHFGHVDLESPAPVPEDGTPLVVVHYLGGDEKAIGIGEVTRILKVTKRWRHNALTAPGSSGGACFDQTLRFVGIHQGGFDDDGRFVPAHLFIDPVLDFVQTDLAPPALWSLDDTITGPLVIGRNAFFEAVAAAGAPAGRVRGVRIKRTAIDSDPKGLSYSCDILERLLLRRGPDHRVVRIPLEAIVDDLDSDIRRRVVLRGLELPDPIAPAPGRAGHAPPAGEIRARAELLANEIETAAATNGVTVWLFFDNPTVALTETARLTIEMLIGAALTKPHLRMVVAGLETVTLPGREFAGIPHEEADRSPGLAVEYIGEFGRADVLDMLTIASRDLAGSVDAGGVAYAADRALVGLTHVNGRYATDLLATVAERLRLDLQLLADGRA